MDTAPRSVINAIPMPKCQKTTTKRNATITNSQGNTSPLESGYPAIVGHECFNITEAQEKYLKTEDDRDP